MVDEPVTHNPKPPLRAFVARLREHWNSVESYQRFAYSIGIFLVASAAFHSGVLVFTGGSLEGPVSWRKPILFGESFGLTAVSVAWVMTFLPKRPAIGWLLMGPFGLAHLYEVSWVSVQQWRGVSSHFNFSTAFDTQAFGIAGIMIAVSASVILSIAIWSFVRLEARPSITWAIRLGMVLLLISQAVGFLIIQNGLTKVIDPQTGQFISQSLAMASTFGAQGSMKIPHALALHAIQLLPLIAFLLQSPGSSEARRTQIVLMAGVGYGGIVAVTLWQTFNGLGPFDLSPSVSVLLILAAFLFLVGPLFTVQAIYRNLKAAGHFT